MTEPTGQSPMTIPVDLEPFRLPNFLPLRGLHNPAERPGDPIPVQIDVGRLSDDQAAAYWNSMQGDWLSHVARRRSALERRDD